MRVQQFRFRSEMQAILAALPLAAQYAFLLRVPLIAALILVALPFAAFFTPARSLLRGLFDLTPASLFMVCLTALSAAAACCMTAEIVLATATLRFRIAPPLVLPGRYALLGLMVGMAIPVIVAAVIFSAQQRRNLARLLLAAWSGLFVFLLAVDALHLYGTHLLQERIPVTLLRELQALPLAELFFRGYLQFNDRVNPLSVHLGAAAALLASLLFYAGLGVWGFSKIGKAQTVPALCSLLMLLLMLTWALGGLVFFFDAFRVPIFLIFALWALATAQFTSSDHYYTLRPPAATLPPCATEVALANGGEKVILVAANGGGIQAAAWTARVLEGIDSHCGFTFRKALRLISSVSGGGVGAACYLHWLSNPLQAKRPSVAAARSSLDEMAWGLAWSDFLKIILPWIFSPFWGRGVTLEKAWAVNAAEDGQRLPIVEKLGDWNEKARSGALPGFIMNATIAESGERLLLGSTRICSASDRRNRVDTTEFHNFDGANMDIDVVTAARLSATFPYLTPAARARAPGSRAHVVDGGYYDNYGMATVVEWLDEALTGAGSSIRKVLVLQIHGSPAGKTKDLQRNAKGRGWFYQALAPLAAMYFTRNAGQNAHNDIELELLTQKWRLQGIEIETVPFEFDGVDAPLSWHLTFSEITAIEEHWVTSMKPCLDRVKAFLA